LPLTWKIVTFNKRHEKETC